MSQPGYVYILVNPSANEFLKIGKTERDPEERARELSSATGVPTPFYVAFQSYFQDCTRAEAFVHERLAKHRVANNREFFHVPLRQAIEAVLEAEKIFKKATPQNVDSSDDDDDLLLDEFDLASDEPWRVTYDEANNFYFGSGDTLQDYEEALKLYKQAARLGCKYAYCAIGTMYSKGEGCIADTRTALDYFKAGARNGDDRCWAEMAGIFFEEKHFENMEKCWEKYFMNPHFLENITNEGSAYHRGYYGHQYFQQMLSSGRTLRHRDKLLQIESEIVAYYKFAIEHASIWSNPAVVAAFEGKLAQFKQMLSFGAQNQ